MHKSWACAAILLMYVWKGMMMSRLATEYKHPTLCLFFGRAEHDDFLTQCKYEALHPPIQLSLSCLYLVTVTKVPLPTPLVHHFWYHYNPQSSFISLQSNNDLVKSNKAARNNDKTERASLSFEYKEKETQHQTAHVPFCLWIMLPIHFSRYNSRHNSNSLTRECWSIRSNGETKKDLAI